MSTLNNGIELGMILRRCEINNVSLQMETVVAETAVVILGKHMKFFDRKEEIATLRNPTFFRSL